MTPAGFQGLKALIVEDNTQMRALLRALLNSIGIHDVNEAINGKAAIELLRVRGCDLILTDLAMAPMDGLEFTRHVRNNEDSSNPFVPIIMVSGHTERYRVEAARDAGITEFLAKPVAAQNLFSRIAEIVERPRAFVRCDSYFGPDRRRRQLDAGPRRRAEDFQQVDVQ